MDVAMIWLMWSRWMLLWFDSCGVDSPSTPHESNQSNIHLLHTSQIRATAIYSTWVKSEQQPSTPHESNQSNSHPLHMSQIIATSIYSTRWIMWSRWMLLWFDSCGVDGCYSDLTHVEWMDVALIWLMWSRWLLLWFDSCGVDGCYSDLTHVE
jgi:hypothetical protein